MTISNTNGQILNFMSTANTMSVGGDLNIDPQAGGTIVLVYGNVNAPVNVGGNLNLSSGTLIVNSSTNINPNLTVAGDFIISGSAVVNLTSGTGAGRGTLTLQGDLNQDGNITETNSGTGYGTIVFAKSGTRITPILPERFRIL
ncbi:MAG: hypothetical protein MZU79_02260 [Anaerotruncus sp.]|nr:hypothetical protein [Anaerotruncus sp.]